MALITSADGVLLFAVDDHHDLGNGTPQSVVYDARTMTPLWDRHSWENAHGLGGTPVIDPPRPPLPAPPPVAPAPAVGGGAVRVLRVTHEEDGPFAPRMMSDRANAWVQGGTAYVFGGSRRTGGPAFFAVDLSSGQITRLRALQCPYGGETEFWLWLPDGTLIIGQGPRLHRHNPFRGDDEVVLDISTTMPGHTLDQWHASDDGGTLSATVKDASYQKVGTVTSHHGKVDYWPANGILDESQVSRSGKHLVIKVDRGNGDENLIIHLDTRETKWVRDAQRAVGHSDCGPDYLVGEADKPDPGGCVLWALDRLNEGPRFLFPSLNLGYVSTRAGLCLHSDDTHLRLVDLYDGRARPLVEHGAQTHPGDPEYYDRRPKANLSPCARVATYMVDGTVYLLVLP